MFVQMNLLNYYRKWGIFCSLLTNGNIIDLQNFYINIGAVIQSPQEFTVFLVPLCKLKLYSTFLD